MAIPTEERIRDALREVDDPEIGINIVDLGLVYGIDVSMGHVHIKMTMTTPACPLHAYLPRRDSQALSRSRHRRHRTRLGSAVGAGQDVLGRETAARLVNDRSKPGALTRLTSETSEDRSP